MWNRKRRKELKIIFAYYDSAHGMILLLDEECQEKIYEYEKEGKKISDM